MGVAVGAAIGYEVVGTRVGNGVGIARKGSWRVGDIGSLSEDSTQSESSSATGRAKVIKEAKER